MFIMTSHPWLLVPVMAGILICLSVVVIIITASLRRLGWMVLASQPQELD